MGISSVAERRNFKKKMTWICTAAEAETNKRNITKQTMDGQSQRNWKRDAEGEGTSAKIRCNNNKKHNYDDS
jgi:hypothetical protein